MRMWALSALELRRVEFAPVSPILVAVQPLCCHAQPSPEPQEQGCGRRLEVFAPRPQPEDLRAASSGLRLGPSGDVITTSAKGCFLLDVLVSLICPLL